jgi:hypothetical protein
MMMRTITARDANSEREGKGEDENEKVREIVREGKRNSGVIDLIERLLTGLRVIVRFPLISVPSC